MPTGTNANDTWAIAHVSEINTYNGLGGTDTLEFGLAARSLFSITKNADGSIAVDSVSSASNAAVYKLKLVSIEVLKFSNGTDIVDLVTFFNTPAPIIINGGSGNDTLNGTSGVDHITGGAGKDRINGKGGNDILNGGTGVDTMVFDVLLSNVLSYTYAAGVLTLTTGLGTTEMREFERVKLTDAYYAFDTQPGDLTWQAAALYRAWFGVMPDKAQLSQWTLAADGANNMTTLAKQMLTSFAPSASNTAVVGQIYQALTGAAASAADLQTYSALIGTGKTYATPGDLYAWAAGLSNNTNAMVGFVGSIQALDASLFP